MMDLVPEAEQAGFVISYNYIRILSAMPALVPGIPVVPAQSQSNFVFAGRAESGRGSLDIVLPKQHLMEMVQYFVAMQMQAQQLQQQQQEQEQGQEQPQQP